jgi:hypothetical protein
MKTKFYSIDCELVKQEQKNFKRFKKEKKLFDILKKEKTIFEGNKTFSDVLIEGIVFAVSTTLILTFTAAIIILITNLIF